MIINGQNDKQLYAHCSRIIAKMPVYQKEAKNAVKASLFFSPLEDAHIKNNLRAHLEGIELGLMDEISLNSEEGKNIVSLYSSKPSNDLSLPKRSAVGNYIRLILIGLAYEKVITLSSTFRISLSSQKQLRTVELYRQVYPPSVFESLIIGTAARVIKYRNELPEGLLLAQESCSASYGTRANAANALARACLTQGVKNLSDFKLADWREFQVDYTSVPERPAISMSSLSETLALYNNDNELKKAFLQPFKSKVVRKSNISYTGALTRISGSRSKSKNLLGEVNYLRKGTRYIDSEYVSYYKSANQKVVSFGNWNNSEIKLGDFSPKSLNSELSRIWVLAQQDFCNSKVERGTKKNALSRMSVLNIYLFSYLPVYFASFNTGEVKFPLLPKDFISAIFVERSLIFEHEFGLPNDFQYPVMLGNFVRAYYTSKSKTNTKNENTAKAAMRDISLFFDYLVSVCPNDVASDFFIKNNPVGRSSKKIKGVAYSKSQKEVMSLSYWSGLRIFVRAIADKVLDDNLAIVSGGGTKKDLSNYPINSSFNLFGVEVEIGHIDISSIGKYTHRISAERTVNLPNSNDLVMLCFMAYSGQRYSNTFWLDVNTYNSLENEDASCDDWGLVQILINTDKVLINEFPIFIPRFVLNMLKKVEVLLGLNKYSWAHKEIDYQGEKGSKWGKIIPLFRTSEGHSDRDLPLAALLKAYETCLSASGVKVDDSCVFYMPAKHLSPKEHIYYTKTGESHIDEVTAYVKYYNEEVVPFTPIKVGTLVTPHSLRVMINSVYSPVLSDEAISKLLTGQTEATVGYYTKDLDSTSSDLISHLSSLMNLKGKHLVSESAINQDDFKRRLRDGTAEFDYQANSIIFSSDSVLDDDSLPSSGLSALRIASASALAFNRTHICPFNNDCPRSIIIELGERNCSACPFTITTTNHLPSIAAEIRSKSELMKELGVKLSSTRLDEIEKETLQKERNKLLRDVTNWYVRLKVMNSNQEELFIMSADGKTRLSHDTPITSDISPLQSFLRRLDEVNGSDLLQTESLKIQSARFMRLAEINISNMDWNSIPEFNDIDVAYNHFKTLCDVASLDIKETLFNIENKFSQPVIRAIGIEEL